MKVIMKPHCEYHNSQSFLQSDWTATITLPVADYARLVSDPFTFSEGLANVLGIYCYCLHLFFYPIQTRKIFQPL